MDSQPKLVGLELVASGTEFAFIYTEPDELGQNGYAMMTACSCILRHTVLICMLMSWSALSDINKETTYLLTHRQKRTKRNNTFITNDIALFVNQHS